MIYFADRKFNILGSASTKMNNGYGLVEDKLTEEIETFTSNYDGVLSVDDNKISEVKAMLNVGNYILYVDDFGENRYYTITDSVSDRKEGSISFQSDAAGLDLLNEVYPPYVATEALTIAQYIEKFAYDSGFTIGLNEIPHLSRKLEWEGSDTGMKRMLSVANSFDKAELSFSFEVEGMLVVRKYINVHAKRGVQLEQELRLNRDIDNIITTESILDLRTAVEPVGGRPTGGNNQEQPPISIEGKVYDDGRYYVKGRAIYDRESNAIWSRYLSPTENGSDEGFIVGRFEYDTLSRDELFNRALAYLKTVNEPSINYDVKVINMPPSARVGDTVNIVDDNDELYLNGRILKKEYSSVTKEGMFTLGDYVIKDSGISEQLQALANRLQLRISSLVSIVNEITYPVVSENQPSEPKQGQQWWKTDGAGKVTDYFVYHEELIPQWQPQIFQQSILNIESLNAVNMTGSNIRGTTITGSTLGNEFDYSEGTLRYKGTSQFLNNTIQMKTDVYAAGVLNAKSKFLIDPMQVHGEVLKADDTLASSYTLTGSGGLEMTTAGVGNIKYDLDGIKYRTATGGFGLDFLYTTNGLTIRPKGGLQNGAIEMEGMTPYIDFHSNGWTTDNYSSRIIASGGNGTNGNGTLTFHGWNHDFITPISATSNPGIRITSSTIGCIASNDLRVSPGTGGALEVADRNGAYRPVRASAFTVSSDRNIKKNITEMSSFNDVIKDLKIYKYNLNTEEDWELKHTGFIMQEVPVDFISPDYSIDLYSIAAINNGAIQENHREIVSLKSEIESLKLQVETLMANHDK